MMGRRSSLAFLALAALSAVGAQKSAPPPQVPRPSVLLVSVSGLGARLGCYGAAVKTPHIDRLARMGRRFTRVYAQLPDAPGSLVSLMTGWRPDKTGVFAPPGEPVEDAVPLEDAFRSAGFFTVRLGPVFGGKAETSYRWDVAESPAVPASRASEILAAHGETPFFLVLSLDARKAPKEIEDEYSPASISLPKPVAWGDIPAIAASPARVDRPGRLAHPTPFSPANRQSLIASEDARAAYLDMQVGTVLEALDRLKLWDKVSVVLVSDHGPDLGEHGELLRKDLLYEETLKTSLIIVAPGMKDPGKETQGLSELVDVYPTLADICGLKRPKDLQGRSLLPLLDNPLAPGAKAVLSVAAREGGYLGRSVRNDRYRYTEWPDGSEELYDHDNDPHEWVNLALDPSLREPIPRLKKLIDDRQASSAPPPARPAPVHNPGARKDNVLLVVYDDLTVHLGAYGYPVKTPNIDRLASRGRRFDRAYAQVAMCSPSRMSFMTSWRPERVDIWNNNENPWESVKGSAPLQEVFHAAGYFTGRIGKVYHGRWNDSSKGWDEFKNDEEPAGGEPKGAAARLESDNNTTNPTDISHFWLATNDRDEDEPDGRRALLAAKFLRDHWKHPFFLALGFAKPHLRWVAPKKYFDMYSAADLSPIPDPPDDFAHIPVIALAHEAIPRPRMLLSESQADFDEKDRARALAAQYAVVSFADAQLGVVLQAMDEYQLWDNTIVVLIGDHGFQLGEHGLWRKDTLFEESAHAPLIIAGPQVRKAGKATSEIAEFLDIYPTLMDMAKLPTPPGVQGTSLLPQLEDPKAKSKGAAFTFRVCAPPLVGRSVRDERYRFTEWPDGSQELYDLSEDPREATNLAAAPDKASTVEAMRKLLYP